jgi:hypothetical protein
MMARRIPANHKVKRILQDQHAVADGQRQRSARSAFAADDRNGGHAQPRHLAQVAGNRLGLPALLRSQAGIRARQVDEADHGRENFSAIFMHRSALR